MGRLVDNLVHGALFLNQAAVQDDDLIGDLGDDTLQGLGGADVLRAGGGADWDLPYESLRPPVLVMTGLQDRVFFDAADVDSLAARLPDGRRIDLADAGHMIPAERPEALIGHLLAWAAEI